MIDLSDPHAPYVAGQIALNGPADGVAAAGRTVFVATNLGGLQIVDASNPAASGSVLVADDDFGVQVLPMHCPDRESAAAPALQPTPGVRFTAMPNPAPAGVPVRLTLYLAADGGTVLAGERSAGVAGPVRLFDAGGRLVRTLAPAHPAAGVEWIWDGRDEHGRVVPAGVYWARGTAKGAARPSVAVVRLP